MLRIIIIIIMIVLGIRGIYNFIEQKSVCDKEWWILVRNIYNMFTCIHR